MTEDKLKGLTAKVEGIRVFIKASTPTTNNSYVYKLLDDLDSAIARLDEPNTRNQIEATDDSK